MNKTFLISLIFITASCSAGKLKNDQNFDEEKSSIVLNPGGKGPEFEIDFTKGSAFNYPLAAIWLEDSTGKYIQTLYVSRSVGSGIFKYGKQQNDKWITASKRAPQTLPYWAHKRGIKAADGLFIPDTGTSVADAYSGASPVKSFVLKTRADGKLPPKFKVMLEINQNWDWNDYWTNEKYPDDEYYKMSCQPALVYEAFIDARILKESYEMHPVGHSHYSGKTGELFTDLSTITTALKITGSVRIRLR